MNDRAETAERVYAIMKDVMGVDFFFLPNDSARFVEDLSADSIDMREIQLRLENEFGIRIHDRTMIDDIVTVGDLVGQVSMLSACKEPHVSEHV